MIRELSVYRCICSKCKGTWITKDHALPMRCAKCNVKTWNDDFDFSKAQIEAPALRSEPIQAAQPGQPIQSEPKDALTAFIAKAQASKGIAPSEIITVEVEEIDQWSGWGKEEQTYDDQTGEMRTYRKHIKTGKVRWLDSETALISV